MAKENVALEADQWNQLLNILTNAPVPWTASNPLIVAMSGQLQQQRQSMTPPVQGNSHDANHLDEERRASGQATAQYPATGEPPLSGKSS